MEKARIAIRGELNVNQETKEILVKLAKERGITIKAIITEILNNITDTDANNYLYFYHSVEADRHIKKAEKYKNMIEGSNEDEK